MRSLPLLAHLNVEGSDCPGVLVAQLTNGQTDSVDVQRMRCRLADVPPADSSDLISLIPPTEILGDA